MYAAHSPIAMVVFGGFHFIVVAGGLYLLYTISRSLKQIAGSLGKKEIL
ncbi:MAG TPA: hypothetical protein VN611_13740 [Patescibacteria group bacterium]|nr:hypothetical protein [Patescibacteria group bacterium]